MKREEQTQAQMVGYIEQQLPFLFYESATPASAEPQPLMGAIKQYFSIKRN